MKYNLFIVILPIVVGITLAILYSRRLIRVDRIKSLKNFWGRIAVSAVLLLIVALYSFFTLGFAATLVFDYVNYSTAKKHRKEFIEIPVTEFHKKEGRRSSNRIFFTFKSRRESFKVSSPYIGNFYGKDPDHYVIKIECREGIWNQYLVESWDVVAK